MATFVKVNKFVDHLCTGVHDFTSPATAAITVALSNISPSAEVGGNPLDDPYGLLANVTQISYANLSSRLFANNNKTLSTGTLTVDMDDLTLTGSGTVADFRYIYFYNDTPTAPVDPLIAHFDHGSIVGLRDTDTYSIQIDPAGLFTLA